MVTFAPLMSAVEVSVSRQVESTVACALGETTVLSACSLAASTPTTLPSSTTSSATLSGMSFCCICMYKELLSYPPICPSGVVACITLAPTHSKIVQILAAGFLLPFSSPLSGHTSAHTRHAPAAHSASPCLASLIPHSLLPFTHASVHLCFHCAGANASALLALSIDDVLYPRVKHYLLFFLFLFKLYLYIFSLFSVLFISLFPCLLSYLCQILWATRPPPSPPQH